MLNHNQWTDNFPCLCFTPGLGSVGGLAEDSAAPARTFPCQRFDVTLASGSA
jgi:hypothetical protein